jgi:hypothetical protein
MKAIFATACILAVLLWLGAVLPVAAETAAPGEETANRLEAVLNKLTGASDTPLSKEQFLGAIFELLDLTAEITPDNQFRADILHRIEVAKDLIRNDSLFNSKARQYLSFAYRQLTAGKKFKPPPELDEFVTPAELQEKMAAHMNGLAEKARAALAAGDAADTARILLEIVFMIITPVEG